MSDRNPRSVIKTILALTTITAVVASTAAYQLIKARTAAAHAAFRVKSPIYHHDLKPNESHSRARWGPVEYDMTTNNLGFRDETPRTVELRSDKPRVLLVGDSFVEGLGVGYQNTFFARVRENLKPLGIDVLNSAVASYSPIIHYRKLRYLLEDVKLDFTHVVAFIDMTDIHDELKYQFDSAENVIERPQLSRALGLDYLLAFVKGQAAFYRTIILSNLYRLSPEAFPSGKELYFQINGAFGMWTIDPQAMQAYAGKGLERASRHMTKLAALLKDKGISLTVAVFPWPVQIYHRDLDSIQVRLWKEWAQKNNAAFINFFPDFVATGENPYAVIEKYFISGDHHWNDQGHKLIADGVIKQLRQVLSRGK